MVKITDAQYALVSIAKAAELENRIIQIAACTGDDYETVQREFVEYAKNHNGDLIQLAVRISRLAALGEPLPWQDPCEQRTGKLDMEVVGHIYGSRCGAVKEEDK